MVVSSPGWLPEHRRSELKDLAKRSHQVVTLAAITGAITGLLVAGFDRLVVDVSFDRLLRLAPWAIAVVPGLGLLVAFAARRFIGGGASASTADEYLHAFHDDTYQLRWRPFVGRLVAAVATLGAGAPMGLEGPSLYAGATIGSNLQRRLPRWFKGTDHRVLLVAGAAAGVAAIFKAPATGAVFALEVPYQDDLARRMLLPALVASATGYLVFVSVNGTTPLFHIGSTQGFAARDLLGAVAVGLIAGVGARGFAWMLRRAKLLAAGPHALLATVVAGVVLGGAFALGRLLTGESLLVGSGYHVVAWASVAGRSVWLLAAILVLRCIATATTVAGGGVGGLFIPLVVAGALTGAIIGGAVDQFDVNLFIIIGVAAFLGAGYRVPLAAVMFIAETTGRPTFIVPGLLAAVAAELVMSRSSVTIYQLAPDNSRADQHATSHHDL
jgi:CIC family chloride channel protein